jgi:hypothetical protein
MKYARERVSTNQDERSEHNVLPNTVQSDRPGYGDKKLEGPNRPST